MNDTPTPQVRPAGRAAWYTLIFSILFLVLVQPVYAGLPDAPSQRQNHYPVALVHGFFGWGRDELFGWKHFGGFTDIQEELKDSGYHTVTPAVGPISSNWDRAVELYYQLVGGCVDYGAAHSAKHNIVRKPKDKCYDALLPGLGEPDENGNMRKVNIIAHSQGVPTVRLLIELLENGSKAEQRAGGDYSELFSGNSPQFIHAVGAVSGANDGSLLAHTIYHELDFENELISAVVTLMDTIGADAIYDFKLSQFRVDSRHRNESHKAYTNRVMRTMLAQGNKNTAFYDLSADGAEKINEIAEANDDVYYMSWSNNTTTRGWLTGFEYPEYKTNFFLSATTLFMGTYNTRRAPGSVDIGYDWRKNDGITSTRSMDRPRNGSNDEVEPYRGKLEPGHWIHMGELNGWDHWDTIGLLDWNHSAKRDLLPLYRNIAGFLAATPAD